MAYAYGYTGYRSYGYRRAYIVQPGDTLSGISTAFYGTPSLYPQLAAANGIPNANLIFPGEVIYLP